MHWRSICWLAHSMRWVLTTPLGSLVEPEVNRNLAIVSGPTRACAASTRGAGSRREQARERASRGARQLAARQHHRRVGRHRRGDRLARRPASLANTRPGVSVPRMWLQLAVVLRHQRIGRRHRRERHAGPHRAQRQRQVLEVVVGQDRDRPLGRQAAVEQRLADGLRALEHLRVADTRCQSPPPSASRRATKVRSGAARAQCSSRSVRRARVVAQRLGRAQHGRAVGAALDRGLEAAADGDADSGTRRVDAHCLARPCPRACRGRRARAPWRRRRSAAMAAISDSMNRPSACDWSAMRGSACITAKFDSGALRGDALRQLDAPWRSPRPRAPGTATSRRAGPPRRRRRGRSASCRSCAPRRSAAGCAPSRRRRRRCRAGLRAGRRRRDVVGHADVAALRQLEPAADHRAVQHRDHRHAAELDLRRTPRATCANAARRRPTSRSISSDRSRPAQKCSPSPLEHDGAHRLRAG